MPGMSDQPLAGLDGDRIALQADRVTRRYGRILALDAVSFEVRAGESVALVGESGSGKTTLLRCFNRLVEPDAGRVVVGGRDAATVDPVGLRRQVGYVPQEGGLLPHWTVRRNAAMVAWLQGREDATGLAVDALGLVGLPFEEFGERMPSELSGGQRQRVAIARALAAHPSIILLDEPFGALDALTRADLQDAFLELRRRLGVTTLMVTHDLHEAVRLADRIIVLRAGRIEQVATPSDLAGNPATEYVAQLLARSRIGGS
jgi:osmoprotectant transport system ATP-binding protein